MKLNNSFFMIIFPGLLALMLLLSGCVHSTVTTNISPQPAPPVTSLTNIPSPTGKTPAISSPSPTTIISPLPSSSPPVSTSVPQPTTASSIVPIDASEADEIINKIIDNTASIASYRLNRNITQTFYSTGQSSGQTSSRIYSQALYDSSSQALEMTNIIALKQPAEQPSWPVVENAIFIVDGTMYMRGLFADKPNIWSKTPVTPDIWKKQDQVRFLMNFLQSDQVSGLFQETIEQGNSIERNIILEIMPDPEILWEFFINQPGIQLPGRPPEGLTYDQIINNSRMKIRVDQITFLPNKVETSLDIAITPEMLPSFKYKFMCSASALLTFSDYNQPVDIVLPEEAEKAEELSLEKAN